MSNDDEILQKLEECTMDAARLQSQVLHSIVEHNGGVTYLRGYLREDHAPAAAAAANFRSAVPLSRYEDYMDCIDRMADGVPDGDHPLISVDPLICFFYSSGTTSMKPKLIPYLDSAPSKAAANLAHQGSSAVLRRVFPPRPENNKILWFIYSGNVTITKGGYKAMAATSFPFHSNKPNSSILKDSVSPREVILGSNVEHQMYCHLLCGLMNCDSVDGIRSPYASGLIKALSLLESKWECLCEDLEHGFPSMHIADAAMRDAVAGVLGGPQPDFSKRIRLICAENQWGGIMGKLWPNARYVRCVTTGSMEQYYRKLKYYAADLPVLCGDYFASECSVAINMDIVQPPGLTRFVMLPSSAYFEFLSYESDGSSGKETRDISSVEVGKSYEVIVTTYRGFYRYRLGDIVRVVGFHNSSPEVEFVMRAPKSSTEVITEKALMVAMASFQLILKEYLPGIEVKDFACFFDTGSSPNQLKIFMEVDASSLQGLIRVLEKCCSSLEVELQGMYSVMREKGEVGPLMVCIVAPGSFDGLQQVAIDNGAPASQYKPPKIIRNRVLADFLEKSCVATETSNPSNC